MSGRQVIGMPQSTFVRTVRLILEEKGLDYEMVMKTPPEIRAEGLHPFGKMPVYRDGGETFYESLGIAHYLLRQYAEQGPLLMTRDIVESARVLGFVGAIIDYGKQTIIRRYIIEYLFPSGADGQPDRAIIDAALPEVEQQLRVYDAATEAHGGMLVSDISLADLYLWPLLANLAAMPEGPQLLDGKPGLAKARKLMEGRASFQATVPPPMPKAA